MPLQTRPLPLILLEGFPNTDCMQPQRGDTFQKCQNRGKHGKHGKRGEETPAAHLSFTRHVNVYSVPTGRKVYRKTTSTQHTSPRGATGAVYIIQRIHLSHRWCLLIGPIRFLYTFRTAGAAVFKYQHLSVHNTASRDT